MERKDVQKIINRRKGYISQETENTYEMLKEIRDYLNDEYYDLALRQLNYLSLTIMDLRDDKQALKCWEQRLKSMKEEE